MIKKEVVMGVTMESVNVELRKYTLDTESKIKS